MTKLRKTFFLIIAAALIFVACGSAEYENSVLKINKDYSINAVYVSDFSSEDYDFRLFKQEAEDSIEEYNNTAGKGSIVLEECAKKDNTAYVEMKYASYEDYRDFNGLTIYAGKLSDAVENGEASGDTQVKSADGSTVTTLKELADDSERSLVMVSEDLEIEARGNLVYMSDNVNVDDTGKIIALCAGEDGNATPAYLVFDK